MRRTSSFRRIGLVAAVIFLAGLFAWPLLYRPHREAPKASRAISPEMARAMNAAIPFAARKLERPKRFLFRGSPAAREQAVDCLATAALYETGGDRDGQRAVMQVVLNRVQTRGFPKTVCGVVYAGATRRTGCQFSFTCDGSLRRRPEHEGWQAARALARRALSGAVFATVGRSTHYHTDWVAPNWNGALDKVAQVHSHIFYQPRAAAPL